jgi:hypothetical protein
MLALSMPAPNMARAQTLSHDTSPASATALFATCTGRYAAVMEHAWLMGRDDAQAMASRAGFEDLLMATAPFGPGLDGYAVLHMRIQSKHALARVLQLADLAPDDRTRRRARAQITVALRPCQKLSLS